MISFALWLSFGKLRKEIALAKIKFAEDHSKIAKDLQIAYNTIFVEEEKNNDNDAISQIRQQIYSINRNFTKLLQKEDLKCVKRLMACLKKTNDKIDLAELRKDLDFLIITFKERIYEY
jgi:intein/homing endonuclease